MDLAVLQLLQNYFTFETPKANGNAEKLQPLQSKKI